MKKNMPLLLQNLRIIVLPYLDCLVCLMGYTMLDSEYTQYLHSVSAKENVITATFFMMGIFNMVGKITSGIFLDRKEEAPLIFSFVGNVFMLLAYISLGLLPYWPLAHEQKQWIILATSPFVACGMTFIMISSYSRICHLKLSLSIPMDTSAIRSG